MRRTIVLHGVAEVRKRLLCIAQGFDPAAQLVFATDNLACDESGLGVRFQAALDGAVIISPGAEEEESIARCRFLRALPRSKALACIGAMRQAWSSVLDEQRPRVVISESIDSYVIETLEKECARRGIEFIGLVACFIDGYFRTTHYGELQPLREPSEEEIEAALDRLRTPTYKPAFVRSGASIERRCLRQWIRNWGRFAYYSLRCLRNADRRRNHVYGAYTTSRNNLHFVPKPWLGERGWERMAVQTGLPVIFLPLQHHPEATIDYWCQNVDVIDYEETLVALVARLAERFAFVVKEHPNVLGFRSPRLYERLRQIRNVVFAPTATETAELLASTDAALVWTGSLGFQAALAGKPVLAMSDVYYMSGPRFRTITTTTGADVIHEHIARVQAMPITDTEQRELVRYVLAGLIPGRVFFGSEPVRSPAQDQADRCLGARLANLVNAKCA